MLRCMNSHDPTKTTDSEDASARNTISQEAQRTYGTLKHEEAAGSMIGAVQAGKRSV